MDFGRGGPECLSMPCSCSCLPFQGLPERENNHLSSDKFQFSAFKRTCFTHFGLVFVDARQGYTDHNPDDVVVRTLVHVTSESKIYSSHMTRNPFVV